VGAVTIDWVDWGEAAFERAARAHRPVLLSLVARWSAASAEMDRTAFADPDVAALVASRFVPVRVDADRRPDVNERYNLGGCPTTAFLTPLGDILWGATFLDAGALRSALDRVSAAFAAERDTIEQRAALERLEPTTALPPARGDPALLDWIAAQVTAPAAHPPEPLGLLFLLRRMISRPERPDEDVLAQWLAHLAGDVLWERPEDNAALLTLLAEAAVVFQDDRLRRRAQIVARSLRDSIAAGALAGVDVVCTVAEACLDAQLVDPVDDLRPFAVDLLERTIGTAYQPGAGLGHLADQPAELRGLLVDHVRAASALLTAYTATGRLPYAMLAEELVQFARLRLWDEPGGFFDRVPPARPIGLLARRVKPFALNCEASRVLCRLAALHADAAYRGAAVVAAGADYDSDARRTLEAQTWAAREFGPLAAPYGLALLECASKAHGKLSASP
jgi:uncharacterized protein YyaL (SSP411 family)